MTSSNEGSGRGWQVEASFSVTINGSGEASFWFYAMAYSSARRVIQFGSQQLQIDHFADGSYAWVSQIQVNGPAYAVTLTGEAGQTRVVESRFSPTGGRTWANVRSLQQTAELQFAVSAVAFVARPWLHSYTTQSYTVAGETSSQFSVAAVDYTRAEGSGEMAYDVLVRHVSVRGDVDGIWADQYTWHAHSEVAATDAVLARGRLHALAYDGWSSRWETSLISPSSTATLELERHSGLPADQRARDRLFSALGWLEAVLFN